MSGKHGVVKVKRPELGLREDIYLVEVWKGLLITSRHFFVNLARHIRHSLGMKGLPGAVTNQYPEDPQVTAHRSRTRHRLLKREDGTPRCVACMLCETVCPAKCIYIQAEESPDVMIEKRAKSFKIDLGMCVFCGYCVEACPEDAIRMDTQFIQFPGMTRKDLVWDMPELMGDKPKVPKIAKAVDPLTRLPSPSSK
ncbi:MAG: NADH-quinone oxidoreductase subunit I [Elusimicrobia bacterium]|nr:NADH-quinone oxidoreductase subunit I [Elusimicrobiota bacterium]